MKKKRKRKLNKLALGGALILGALFITLSTHSPALFAKRAGRAWLQSNNPALILLTNFDKSCVSQIAESGCEMRGPNRPILFWAQRFAGELVAKLGRGIFVLTDKVRAYDQQATHPALTDEAIDFYNLNFPDNPLSQEDKQLLIRGAIEEDTPPRWLNHFYDPVYNVGWIGYTTSKKWAMDSGTQQTFTDSAYSYGGFANLFSDNLSLTDFSYQRALHDYASGNRERAMLAMGHVMHLLEDSNVPEHTRGDTHLPWHGTESPYEKTMAKWSPSNFNISVELVKKSVKSVLLGNLADYFDEIARYSNGYFFSEDTIFIERYTEPTIDFWEYKNIDGELTALGYKKDGDKFRPLVKKLNKPQIRNLVTERRFTLDDNLILDDYWSRLAPDFVAHGAGALKLFLDQAELIKQEYAKETQKVTISSNFIGRFFSFLGFSGGGNRPVTFNPEFIESIISQPRVLGALADIVDDVNDVAKDVGNDVNDVGVTPTPSPTPLVIGTPEVKPPREVQPPKTESEATPTPLFYGSSSSGSPSNNVTTNATPTPSPTLTPTPSPSISFTPTPEVEPPQEAQPQETPEPTLTPTLTPTPEVEPPAEVQPQETEGQIVINEIAWMGTGSAATLSSDEWLELYNTTSSSVDVSGWRLKSLTDNSPDIIILASKTIEPFGFFLMERTSDDTISDISADQIYTGNLNDGGEILELRDKEGNLQDLVSKSNDGWYAGDKITRSSMERIDPLKHGDDPQNWSTNNGLTCNGKNAAGNPINGTPRAHNSVYHTPTPTPTPAPLLAGIVWQFDVPDANYVNQLAIGPDGTVYFGAPNDVTGVPRFYAIGEDGIEKWHHDNQIAGFGVPTTPAISDDGAVYFGHLLSWITALNSDGTLLWQYDTSRVNGVSVDEDGNVYATSDNKMINKIGQDGETKWQVVDSFAFGFTPVVIPGDNDVYLTVNWAGLPGFYRLASGNGSVIWQNRVSDGYQYQAFDPVFDQETDKFYTATTAGHIVSVNRLDGTIDSHLFAFGVPATTKVAIFDNILVFGIDLALQNPASGQAVIALNKTDKSKMWIYPVDSRVNSQIALDSEDNLYFSTRNGKVYSLDQNGQERWVLDLGISTDSYPVIWNGSLFISAGGKLFKLAD